MNEEEKNIPNTEDKSLDLSDNEFNEVDINSEGESLNNSSSDELELLKNENISLTQRVSELQNKHLSMLADTENFKKRMIREQNKSIELGNEKLLVEMLPILDNLQRAIDSGNQNKDFDSFYQGVLMIEKDFSLKLENFGLQVIGTNGEIFNPQIHEAYSIEEVDNIEKDIVLQELQRGYTLKDKVIRTSKVKVGKPKKN